MGVPKINSLGWWAKRLYGKLYIDLTDEEATAVFNAREEADGEKREPESQPDNSSSPSQNLTE
jgi:hypothetical protein